MYILIIYADVFSEQTNDSLRRRGSKSWWSAKYILKEE